MTLYDYINKSRAEEGAEFTVHDNHYDIETYFYKTSVLDNDWDKAMEKVARKLEVVEYDREGVTVNLSDVIEQSLENSTFKKLFIYVWTERIMEDIEQIFAGYVSEKWMTAFAECLGQE